MPCQLGSWPEDCVINQKGFQVQNGTFAEIKNVIANKLQKHCLLKAISQNDNEFNSTCNLKEFCSKPPHKDFKEFALVKELEKKCSCKKPKKKSYFAPDSYYTGEIKSFPRHRRKFSLFPIKRNQFKRKGFRPPPYMLRKKLHQKRLQNKLNVLFVTDLIMQRIAKEK